MDAYEKQIEFLEKNPGEIENHWEEATGVFDFASADRQPSRNSGCLSMIRAGKHVAATPELTEAIRNDERIPDHPHKIKVGDLPVFAGWHRRLDKELGRTPPVFSLSPQPEGVR